MKFYINNLILAFLCINYCISQDRLHSDIIDGPANVRDKPNGKVLFELFDDVAVTTKAEKDNWYQIGVPFMLLEQHHTENMIRENTYFINRNGDSIGKTKSDLKFYSWDGPDNQGYLLGYTFIKNIKKKFIPERMLENLIQNKKYNTKKELTKFLNKYHFELYGNHEYLLPEIDMYTISESILYDITPTFRMSLLFKENRIIGVAHTRPIEIEGYKSIELYDSQKFTVLSNCEDEQFISALKNSLIQFFEKAD